MDLSRADLADLLEKAKRGEANQSQARVGITLNFGIQREGEWSAAKPLYHVSYVVGDDKPAPYGDEDFIIGAYLDIQNEGSGI